MAIVDFLVPVIWVVGCISWVMLVAYRKPKNKYVPAALFGSLTLIVTALIIASGNAPINGFVISVMLISGVLGFLASLHWLSRL